MNPKGVLEFLKVARRLLSTTKGLTKADIMEFARRSFGQVSDYWKDKSMIFSKILQRLASRNLTRKR